jgi:hypothetical protein
VITLAAGAYVFLLSRFTEFLAPALAGAGEEVVSPLWVMALFLALLLAGAAALAGPGTRIGEARKTAYVLALGAGQVTSPRSRPVRPGRRVRTGAGSLMPDSQGANS